MGQYSIDELIDFVLEFKKPPTEYEKPKMGMGKTRWNNKGTIEFYYNDVLNCAKFCTVTRERVKFMDEQTNKVKKLKGVSYFLWKPIK